MTVTVAGGQRPVARRYGAYHWRVSPKPKVRVAREHLTKAQDEAAGGDPRDALQWGFASMEAAIDALAATRGIAMSSTTAKTLTSARYPSMMSCQTSRRPWWRRKLR